MWIIPFGASNPTIEIFFCDDSGVPLTGKVAADFPTVYYSKSNNTAKVSITLSDLAAETTSWTSGGIKEKAGGWYRLDLPTAAVSASANNINIFGYSTGKNVMSAPVVTGPIAANTTYFGGTIQTARDIGASVLLSNGTGTGQLLFASGVVSANLAQILATALTQTGSGYLAAALVKLLDVATPVMTVANVNQTGDHYAASVIGAGTATAGASTTITLQTAIGASNRTNGCLIVITGGTGIGQVRQCVSYNNSTLVQTVDRAWVTNPDNTSVYRILAASEPQMASNTQLAAMADLRTVNDHAVTDTTSGLPDVNASRIGGTVQSAGNIYSLLSSLFSSTILFSGTASSATSSTLTLPVSVGADNLPNGCLLVITGGTGVGQVRQIRQFTSSSKVIVIDRNWVTNPDATSTYAILAASVPRMSSNTDLYYGSDFIQLHGTTIAYTTPGIMDVNLLSTDTGAIVAASFAANSITASALAADAVAEIQSGLATTGSIVDVQNSLSTLLTAAAISVSTDGVIIATSQPNYAPSKAGDKMDLINAPNTTALQAIRTEIDTNSTKLIAIDTVTTKLDDTLEDDAGTWRFTANALEEAPTDGSAPTAQEIREEIDDHSVKLASISLVTSHLATTIELNGMVYRFTADALSQAPTAGSAPSVEEIRQEIDDNSTVLAAIEADTQDIQSRLPAALVAGKIDASIGDIDATTANKLADHTLRRSQANIESSADGDTLSLESQYGFVQQAQKSNVSGGTLTVRKTDGTVLGTKTVTSNIAAAPVTGVQ